MGAADAIPGVSGGTIALITGIYERLITALTTLDPAILRVMPRLHRPEARAEFFTSLREMDVPFLLVLGTGMVTALVLLARVAQVALQHLRGPTFAFFFGLIGASALVLADRRWLIHPRQVVAGIAGFSFAFAIAGATGQGALPSSLPVVFVAGVFAISGMLLPGISGAFILLLLGQYDYMTATLNEFIDALLGLAGSSGIDQVLQKGAVVATFLVGAFVGLFTVAYAVRWALDRYRNATLAFLVSLMLGSLRLPVIEVADAWEFVPATIAGILVAGVVGAVAILALDHYTVELTY
jgi:putative membrane protein